MHLKKITLENFRNYPKLEVEFDRSAEKHLFIGDNAQGKTNFLEALSLLSLAKSFRTSKHEFLIEWDKDYTRIVGEVDQKNELTLEFFMSIRPVKKKNLRKNGVDVQVKDFIGELNTVLFHPEDLNMIYLSPSLRRKYLNTILSQVDPMYFDSLVSYNRIIKQRNKLLLTIEKYNDELEAWDTELSKFAYYVLNKRREFVDFTNKNVDNHYQKISNISEKLQVEYDESLENVREEKDYLSRLKESERSDLRYKCTTKGIHRDDLNFLFNKRNINNFGSRGEMRTLIIALKLTEIDFIEAQTGGKPILLLDDVFSELDKSRQKFLLSAITGFQSFITTTHHDFTLNDAKVFEIEKGIFMNG